MPGVGVRHGGPMSATWYTVPPRRRLPVWATVLLGAALAAALGCVLWVGALVVAFSGGLDDVLDVRKPTEDSRSVVKARERAAREVPARHEEVTAALPASTGVQVSEDGCRVGQHNWKVDHDYDLDCVLSAGEVYALSSASDVGVLEGRLAAVLAEWDSGPPSSYGVRRQWTSGGSADGEAGVTQVTLHVLGDGPVAPYQLGVGTGDGRDAVTRDGRPYPLELLRAEHPGVLVVVTTSERYFYA